MARPRHNLDTRPHHNLVPLSTTCLSCGHAAHIAYHTQRIITTLAGQHHLHVVVRRCMHPACPRYHQPYRPEAEGAWALPHGEYGLDVIAADGTTLPDAHLFPVSSALSPGNGGKLGLAARRVWPGRDCFDWDTALLRSSQCPRNSSSPLGSGHADC